MGFLVFAPFEKGQKKCGLKEGCYELKQILREKTNSFTVFDVDEDRDGYIGLYNLLNKSSRHILIGGDHSIGQSSVASSIYKVDDVKNLYVIWIDAHADTNTLASSITKNLHGMPLAGIMGYEQPWFEIKSTLPLTNLLYFGIRDLAVFHVSWDVDSLDPKYCDSTGCLANDGLSPDDIIKAIKYVKDKLICLDVVEYNPLLGDRVKSIDTIKYVLNEIFY